MPNCDFYEPELTARFWTSCLRTESATSMSWGRVSVFTVSQFSDFRAHFAITDWRVGSSGHHAFAALCPRRRRPSVARRVNLNPESCNVFVIPQRVGAYFSFILSRHARAIYELAQTTIPRREPQLGSDTIQNLGSPSWTRPSRVRFLVRLNRFIRSLGSRQGWSPLILPHAAALQSKGFVFQG